MPSSFIVESEMKFGPFNEENIFHIEKIRIYEEYDKPFKIGEFIILSQDSKEIKIVEAKMSSPKPENTANFDSYLSDISEKLANTLNFYISLKIKRHPKGYKEMPAPFQNTDISNLKFKLILVINGHAEAWLPPIKEALYQKLKPFCKIWNLSSDPVVVLNDKWARQFQLIE